MLPNRHLVAEIFKYHFSRIYLYLVVYNCFVACSWKSSVMDIAWKFHNESNAWHNAIKSLKFFSYFLPSYDFSNKIFSYFLASHDLLLPQMPKNLVINFFIGKSVMLVSLKWNLNLEALSPLTATSVYICHHAPKVFGIMPISISNWENAGLIKGFFLDNLTLFNFVICYM